MTVKNLYATVTNTSGLISIDVIEGYKSLSSTCTIVCESTTLSLGDSVIVDMGYEDDHGVVFTGILKKISKAAPDNSITLTCFDVLIKASDYFMAVDDPQHPFQRTNIDAADLVADLLAEANITSYTPIPTTFIFSEPQFNLVTVADAIAQINGIIAYHIWAEADGTIRFEDRRPYVMGTDTSSFTFITGNSGTIITNEYNRSDDDLRNRVVVYGLDPIIATASITSPYLPTGFYKTAVIASPLITEQTMAQDSADFNLELYNRLTRNVTCEVIGNYQIHSRMVATVTEAHTGVSGDWLIYNANHSWSDTGYIIRMVLKA
jgi:hypothetical protein